MGAGMVVKHQLFLTQIMGKGLAVVAVADQPPTGGRRGFMDGGLNGTALALKIKALRGIGSGGHKSS
ncbi:hypothetical protein GCM10009096_34540 [Parasphingorhabdus litoris]|uniref:Uncharacterized protein n=1 Tax=Parasphingorhabdus litoris TaxID=394733 RepID=A0ABN1B287_9SPHN